MGLYRILGRKYFYNKEDEALEQVAQRSCECQSQGVF